MDNDAYQTERLDHLGIVAEVCREIGLAAWLDAQAPHSAQQVSIGTATIEVRADASGHILKVGYVHDDIPNFGTVTWADVRKNLPLTP